jgi:hypothetical protein
MSGPLEFVIERLVPNDLRCGRSRGRSSFALQQGRAKRRKFRRHSGRPPTKTAAAVAAAIAAKQASAVRYSLTIVLTGARSGTQHIIVQAASRAWGTVVTAQGALEATHSA